MRFVLCAVGSSVYDSVRASFCVAHRTRRIWLPNVQQKSFFSQLLDKTLNIRVTTGALRCIDKAGGLDNYLLYTREANLGSELGVELKTQLKSKFFEMTGFKFVRFERERNDRLLRDALQQREELAAASAAAAQAVPQSNARLEPIAHH